jgi:uncharacterized membrane protein YgcG
MPDSQVPPIWGSAYDERDLDALLSGETGSTPVALQPVERTLAALCGAATRRELSDEAVARAAFRAFVPVSPPTGPLPWAAGEEPAAVTSHTLVLPPADHRQQPAARHRHRRRTASSARRPSIAVTGAAAAALIVVATAVTGALTGSMGELTSFGRQPAGASASARVTEHSPRSQGVLVTGAARDRIPSPKPTVSAPPAPRPTPDPGSLCREYFAYLGHPTPDGREAWISLGGQLAKLAGSPSKIGAYCLRHLYNPFGGKGAWATPGTYTGGFGAEGGDSPGTGSLGAGSVGAGSQGAQGSVATEQGQSGDPAAAVGRP